MTQGPGQVSLGLAPERLVLAHSPVVKTVRVRLG
jgi:hypothetical protein